MDVCMIAIFNTGVEDRNFYYLSGIEEPCKGVVVSGRKPVVLASPLESGIAEKYARMLVYRSRSEFWKLFGELVGDSVVGVNFRRLTVKTFNMLKKKGFRLGDASAWLSRKRAVKSREEISKIRKACRIASRSIEEFRELIRPGVKELELKAELERIAVEKGAEGFAFETIVASGPRSAIPHATASGRRLHQGDTVVVDFGPTYRMYASDITRSFSLGCSSEFKEAYEKVLEAQGAVVRKLKEGVSVREIREAAEKLVGKLAHSLGHGVGLDVHEAPSFTRGKLKRGMVLTVEPGIYKGFGVRVEDVFVVGGKLLTSAPKELDFAVV